MRHCRLSIRDVIIAINQMEADGVIDRYAIGGAVGATFYLEPVATLDVDVFVAFRPAPGQLLASPKPIFIRRLGTSLHPGAPRRDRPADRPR